MKKLNRLDIKFGVIVFIGLLVIYFITRYGLSDFYTPEWAARSIYTYISTFLIVMSLLGYRIFVLTAITGYIVGLIAGELFGGFERHVPPQYLHWGWLILIVVFAAFCAVGYIFEKKRGK